MTDPFNAHSTGLSDPVENASAITPSDSADLATSTRAIYVGTPGNLRASLVSGDVVTFQNLSGGWHPLRVSRVWATGTSAAALVGCH